MLPVVKQSHHIEKEKGQCQGYHCAHGVGDGGGNSQEVFRGKDLPGGGGNKEGKEGIQ